MNSYKDHIRPEERLIVALDVPNAEQAFRIVDELNGVVSFFKIGLELLMSGSVKELINQLVKSNRVFIDLKLPNDVPTTISNVVRLSAEMSVSFLTLSNSVSAETIMAACKERKNDMPKLLFVPCLSSTEIVDMEKQLLQPSYFAWESGVDGFIVSGDEIKIVRQLYPNAIIVSPGIKSANSFLDDHKRCCSASKALQFGADYIVVGRPITQASNIKEAAIQFINEMATI